MTFARTEERVDRPTCRLVLQRSHRRVVDAGRTGVSEAILTGVLCEHLLVLPAKRSGTVQRRVTYQRIEPTESLGQGDGTLIPFGVGFQWIRSDAVRGVHRVDTLRANRVAHRCSCTIGDNRSMRRAGSDDAAEHDERNRSHKG